MKIAGSEVRVAGRGGVLLYEGTAEADREGNIVVAPQGKIELSAEDGERAIHNRGKEVTYYLAWEHEDFSHPSNRYRDAPQQKDYDWMKLGTHVASGLMIAGGIAALAAGGVLLLGAAAATAVKIGITVFLAGSLYVGEQALSDMKSGPVSDLDRYTRKAVAGSVVGFLTGASGLLMAEASLCGVLALGFGEGLVGSIVTQKLLNEDGEIDWGVAIAEAGFSAVTAGLAWKERRSVRGVGGGSETLKVTGGLPQDISEETFNRGSQLIRERVGDISDDIVVQGSRASGTAKPTSDIDIAIRVTPEKFDELIQNSFNSPNPGSTKERTMLHAIETGKIQAGEAGLRGLRKELEQIFGMEVDISIIKENGAFDNPPFIPIKN